VALLVVANTVNIAADLAAIGAVTSLVIGGQALLYAVIFGLVCLTAEILIPYHLYAGYLKFLTWALFVYVATAFTVAVPWLRVLHSTFLPSLSLDPNFLTMVVAIFGTTISPYLFFWQTSEEVEDMELNHRRDLKHSARQTAKRELRRMATDTFIGMAISNLIAFFIMLTTAVTLNRAGHTDIQTSAQAAQALRPIAGQFAFLLFSLGIIGTGFLAVPVLAGSSGYAVAEAFGLPKGLEKKPGEARTFYGVIVAAMVVAVGSIFLPLDPIKMLFWSAVINGAVSVPILAAMMLLARSRHQMGAYVANPWQRLFGWGATGVMSVAVVTMFALG
jgi:Mn2+/Fe2+ NRAMP family transporter